jgi:3-phosphoshikimate 1-carboxyvinyltransferase
MSVENQGFSPIQAPLTGSLTVSGDKSISHRAVLLSAMARGTSHLTGVLDSADVRSSIGAVSALGARVDLSRPPGETTLSGTICGWGEKGPHDPDDAIDCGNSGTTTRLLLGMLAGYDVRVTLKGDSSLSRRPMRRVTDPLLLMGAQITSEGVGHLPMTIQGSSRIIAIDYVMPVASAQVKTAILLAGLHATGMTYVCEPAPSRNHTELMLPAYGKQIVLDGLSVSIEGCPEEPLVACDQHVPGDPSSAAFILVAAALTPGSDVAVKGISLNPTRAGCIEVLKRMGATLAVAQTQRVGDEVTGDVRIRWTERLQACEIAEEEIPSLIDEVPILALLATAAQGMTVFRGVGELRVKESDRLASVVDGLTLLGCSAWAKGDDLYVAGGVPTRNASLSSKGDHRLAMTWAIAGLCFGVETTVDDFECVGVSYPGFLGDLTSLVHRAAPFHVGG